MSKRKFSKKEVAISIAAAALAIATVGGAVAIHKDSSNSNTGHSITVEQSDYSKKKEEAIQQIQDAVKDLSDDQQSEIDSYIKQNIENIQKSESERTIESTLQETLDYISDKSVTVHVLFDKPSVEIESWKEKYLIDFDNYVSDCRYCLNSGLNLPDEPMLKDYDPALIAERQKIEEELKQEAAAAGMTVEEYAANDFISPKQQTTNKKATKKQPTL